MMSTAHADGPSRRRSPAPSLLLALLLVFPALATAQSTARVSGAVSDPTGAVIPGAQVEIHNEATGVFNRAETNAAGSYSFPYLIPGPYELAVEAEGFQRYARSNLVLESGQRLALDIELALGETTETITVTAETPLLQSSSSSIDQLIENKTVANMPLVNRRALSVMRLMGNVAFASEVENEGLTDFSLAGGRNRQEAWLLDGGNMQIVTLVTGAISVNPPAAAIQEVKVEVNGYAAEFGRSSSGIIQLTTKSGTNQLHGELYEYHRNDAFDARSFFAPEVAPRKYNVFGGTIGGPIVKDRTHFFFSYERNDRRLGSTRTMSVPTAAEVGGDFSAASGVLLDPTTGNPFANGVVPASRFDPVGKFFADLYPTPNVAGAGSGANNFRKNAVSKLQGDSFIARVDHIFSASDRIYGRYLDYRSTQTQDTITPNPGADPSSEFFDAKDPFFTTVWHHNFSPTIINEFRFTHSRRSNTHISRGVGSNLVQESGLQGVPNPDGMAMINVTGFSQLGRGSVRLVTPQVTTQLIESATWIQGNHAFKWGGEYRKSSLPDLGADIRSGRFRFNDVATGRGFGMAALLLGWVNDADVNVNPLLKTQSSYVGLYFQDDWKVTPRFSLNYGLRWDLDTPRREVNQLQSGFDPFQINPVSATPGVFTFVGVTDPREHAHNFDYNNFGPRFGFAWRPFGQKTVIRAAYGLMTGPHYQVSTGRSAGQGFGDIRSFVSSDNGLTPVFRLQEGMPGGEPEALGPGFGAVRVGDPVRQSGSFFGSPGDRDHPNSYAHHFNFNVQRQMGTLLVEAAYIANLGHRLGDAVNQNINEVHPDQASAVRSQLLRPYPQFANLTWIAPSWGNSSYHSTNLKLEKRYSAGLNLLLNYTWSKFLDDVPTIIALGGRNGHQTFYDRSLDKAMAGPDIRHRIAGSAVYEIPVGKGRRFDVGGVADKILGGWNLGVITEMRTGSPFGVREASNRLNTFSPLQRSNIVGEPELSGGRSTGDKVDRYFNTDAFAFPGAGKLGNAARTHTMGPGFVNFDVSVLKDFRIDEQRFVQLRGEFFNVFNHANFDVRGLGTTRGAGNFGRLGSSFDGRIVQLGLRIVY